MKTANNNMRLLLTVLSLFIFSACQKQATIIETHVTADPLNTAQLINGINHCHQNTECLAELNSYFTELKQQALIEQELAELLPEENIPTANIDPAELTAPNVINSATEFNQPLLTNTRVQAALNEWLTWKRPKLIETWNNYQFLKAKIYPPFAAKKIPEAFLLAIIAQESGGRVHSMSSAGASGLFQFMPATADRFGVVGTIGDYDARFHPESAAKGAADYIVEQRGLYGDDLAKILAAYNSGENRLRRLNTKYKNQSIWTNPFFSELPSETQDYISIVLSAMLVFESPEAFNVKLNEIDGSSTIVLAKRDTSLSELAVCFGQENNDIGWYRILRNLNSSIKANRIIKQNSVVVIPNELKDTFETKCHDNNLMALAKQIHDADFPDLPVFTWYNIKKGDSLNSISRKFNCSNKQEIAQLNELKAPRYLINVGKKLKVPRC